MHRRALVLLPLVLLALNACRDGSEPGTASKASPSSSTASPTASPTTTTPTPTATHAKSHRPASPSRSAHTPKLAGPRTNCGTVQPPGNGPTAAVGVLKGRVACATAMAVFRTYYRRDTPKQGSAGVATVRGWLCASNSAAQTNITGRMSTCRTSTTTISADVIP
ncbi:hypothetical protein [Actinoallomurus sp. NPDC050550]|uniref:hypothetical protein n=1 Tax=Actinoallomurus sp. NPDC050550 TaxID=3154937 RepID=UPI0033C5ED0B